MQEKNIYPWGWRSWKRVYRRAVLAHENGFDGAIQIFPMGCMPEIVSKAILPTISKDKDFPIMSLLLMK